MADKVTPDSAYPYAEGDRIAEPNTYFYTTYGGRGFLAAYTRSRDRRAAALAGGGGEDGGTASPSLALFAALKEDVARAPDGGPGPGLGRALAGLVKRFEVTKRVFTDYGPDMKPALEAAHDLIEPYLAFAELMEAAFARWGRLPHLNVLLKVLDTLQSVAGRLGPVGRARLETLFGKEKAHVNALAQRAGVPPW